jgi:hypothetical protein
VPGSFARQFSDSYDVKPFGPVDGNRYDGNITQLLRVFGMNLNAT